MCLLSTPFLSHHICYSTVKPRSFVSQKALVGSFHAIALACILIPPLSVSSALHEYRCYNCSKFSESCSGRNVANKLNDINTSNCSVIIEVLSDHLLMHRGVGRFMKLVSISSPSNSAHFDLLCL